MSGIIDWFKNRFKKKPATSKSGRAMFLRDIRAAEIEAKMIQNERSKQSNIQKKMIENALRPAFWDNGLYGSREKEETPVERSKPVEIRLLHCDYSRTFRTPLEQLRSEVEGFINE